MGFCAFAENPYLLSLRERDPHQKRHSDQYLEVNFPRSLKDTSKKINEIYPQENRCEIWDEFCRWAKASVDERDAAWRCIAIPMNISR